MKLALIAALAGLICAPAHSQKLELKFDDLAAKASSKVELDLDGKLLQFLVSHIDKDDDPTGMLRGVKAIHIRSFEFGKDGEWSEKDVDHLRKQVAGGRWTPILKTKGKEGVNEVHVAMQGDTVTGCLIIAGEERELEVVYLEGSMGLAQLQGLGEGDLKEKLAMIVDMGK